MFRKLALTLTLALLWTAEALAVVESGVGAPESFGDWLAGLFSWWPF